MLLLARRVRSDNQRAFVVLFVGLHLFAPKM
jgi:hypothetical protein